MVLLPGTTISFTNNGFIDWFHHIFPVLWKTILFYIFMVHYIFFHTMVPPFFALVPPTHFNKITAFYSIL